MLRVLFLNLLGLALAQAMQSLSEMENERSASKPWYMKDVSFGPIWIPISPFSLLCMVLAGYAFYNIFTNKVFCEASHILMSGENAEKALKDLKKEIKDDPAKFATLAAKHSECPSGKSSGGMLGKFKRYTMAPPFDKAAFDKENQVGKTIGPIQTSFGWHLIYIHKRRLD
jgi:peptidyl-prolyl cis-trans isomerase C